MSKKKPTIPSPKEGLFGVSIHADGTLENVGIGSFDVRHAEKLANRLNALADSIRAKSLRHQPGNT